MLDLKIFRDKIPCDQYQSGMIATIGNFDGVHLGHQAIFQQLAEFGQRFNLPTIVITLEPPPPTVLHKHNVPSRLTNLREKLLFIQQSGINRVLILHFNQRLANLSAKQFIWQILIKNLRIRHLLIGEDFRFGKDRTGHVATLLKMGKEHNFTTNLASPVTQHKTRISSSLIRDALHAEDFSLAEKLLGRPYNKIGKVCYGQQLGNKMLGIPTANLHLNQAGKPPISGVFIVKVQILGTNHPPMPAVANWGTKPTITQQTKYQLEVHLLNFTGNLYNKYLKVQFIQKIRDEQKFANLSALQQQLRADINTAEQYFENLDLGLNLNNERLQRLS